MKQHYTLFTILFSLFTLYTPSIFGQQCRDYTCVIAKVERLMKQPQKDYKAILDNLDSAEGYPDSKAEQIRALRRRAFVLIENEKNEAKSARTEAERAREETTQSLIQLEKEKNKAIQAEKAALAEKIKAANSEITALNEKKKQLSQNIKLGRYLTKYIFLTVNLVW